MIKYLIQTVGTHGQFCSATHSRDWWCGEDISAADLSVAFHCTSVIPPITANDCFQKEPSTSSVHTSSSSSSTPTRTFLNIGICLGISCCLSESSLLVTTVSYVYLLSFEVVVPARSRDYINKMFRALSYRVCTQIGSLLSLTT